MRGWICVVMVGLVWACNADDDADPGGEDNADATPIEADPDAGAGGSIDEPEPCECWLVETEALGVVGGEIEIEIGLAGPVTQLELLVGDSVVVSQEVDEGEDSVTLTWDTESIDDGDVSVMARAHGGDGPPVDSEPTTLIVDNTPPTAALTVSRLSVVNGTIEVGLDVAEANPLEARLLNREGVIMTAEGVDPLSLDTTTLEDGVHWLRAEIEDAAGHIAASQEVPVVVVNNGEELDVTYNPGANATVPTTWETTEYHTRVQALSQPNVKRIITWLWWDGDAGWRLEYAVGQGICPHRGIMYVADSSDSGELIVDLPRAELAEEAEARYPPEEQGREVFPFNDDPLTFGAFFGHIDPLDPELHVRDRVAIESHFVVIYE